MRTLNACQAIYLERSKSQRYGGLADLMNENYLNQHFGSGRYRGYLFKIEVDPKSSQYLYKIWASPIESDVTGTRYFFTNQSGVIRFHLSRPATENDRALGGH
jgi:hypothetical protein